MPVKRRQRVCRPLGGISPLSDRAPRDNGDAGRPSEYEEAQAISRDQQVEWLPRSPRARHADTVNARNLGDL